MRQSTETPRPQPAARDDDEDILRELASAHAQRLAATPSEVLEQRTVAGRPDVSIELDGDANGSDVVPRAARPAGSRDEGGVSPSVPAEAPAATDCSATRASSPERPPRPRSSRSPSGVGGGDDPRIEELLQTLEEMRRSPAAADTPKDRKWLITAGFVAAGLLLSLGLCYLIG